MNQHVPWRASLWDRLRGPPLVALLGAVVLGFFALWYWSPGRVHREHQRRLAQCREQYARARTSADTVGADGFEVERANRGRMSQAPETCREYRARGEL
jgi:hypothetical protein